MRGLLMVLVIMALCLPILGCSDAEKQAAVDKAKSAGIKVEELQQKDAGKAEENGKAGDKADAAGKTAGDKAVNNEVNNTGNTGNAGAQGSEQGAVQPQEHDYSILITKSCYSLQLMDKGKAVLGYSVALGKNVGQKEKRGDMKTPEGVFVVDEIIDSRAWTHDFGDGKGEIAGAYGPWFISLDTSNLSKGAWDGIGIHGTHDPNSIGTLASEGCIRLRNQDVETLRKYVRVGMKVEIQP